MGTAIIVFFLYVVNNYNSTSGEMVRKSFDNGKGNANLFMVIYLLDYITHYKQNDHIKCDVNFVTDLFP